MVESADRQNDETGAIYQRGAAWRGELTGAIATGTNPLEIQVANLWPNRFIGDQSLPEEKRFA